MTTAITTFNLPNISKIKVADPILDQLLPMMTFTAISDNITHGTTSGGTVFKVPHNIVILGVGLSVTEAWNGTASKLQFGDGTTAGKYATYNMDVIGDTRSVYNAVLSNRAATGSIVVTITLDGATTGECRLWITYRAGTNARGLPADINAGF